jgi:large subunit ribosomal protein L21
MKVLDRFANFADTKSFIIFALPKKEKVSLRDLSLTNKKHNMYAIVEIAGQQFKVERGNKVYVHRLQANEGADVEFDRVLMMDNGGKVNVGSPTIEGAKVAATVVQHLRGDKVLVFKKKRRKTYQKLNGHRQDYTQILIQGVLGKGESVKEKLEVKKPAGKPVHHTKTAEVKAEVEAAPVKKAPAKKAAAKKATTAKKTTTRKKKEE